MIGCFRARRRMWGALGGELPERQAENFKRHLAGCESCRVRFGELSRWMDEVRSLNSAPLKLSDHEWFWTRLKSRLGLDVEAASLPAPTIFQRGVTKWIPLSITAAVLLGLIVGITHYQSESEKVRYIVEEVTAHIKDESIITIDLTEGEMREDGVIIYQVQNPEMTIIYFTDTSG